MSSSTSKCSNISQNPTKRLMNYLKSSKNRSSSAACLSANTKDVNSTKSLLNISVGQREKTLTKTCSIPFAANSASEKKGADSSNLPIHLQIFSKVGIPSTMKPLTLTDLSLKAKRVLMRVDFNVPLNKDGSISDDSRIRASLPSIEYVLTHGASLILMSHLGRPKAAPDPQFSLAPCAKRLSELLKKPVALAPDCVGPKVEKMASQLKPGEVLLLENIRFHPGEETPEKEPTFAASLAKLGDLYVNDAFGTAHRAHASTALIASYFPSCSAAGFLMEKEITFLSPLLHNPKRPFYAILGGAKVSTKIGVLKNLLSQVDALFIGGGMAFTFLKAQGLEIGSSPFVAGELYTAKDILRSPKP